MSLFRLQMQGKNKYEYDSDEEVEGGTWEHKLREKVHTTCTTFICIPLHYFM